MCESSGEGLPYSIAEETQLSMLVTDIWILADLYRQNKQTAAVSSMLFIMTSSQPCYCMEHKHKTAAPPCLVAKPRRQGPIMLYSQSYGMDTVRANLAAFC